MIAPTVSQGQGLRREAGSGGSRRQTCDLRNTNLIRGCAAGRVGTRQRSPMQSRAKAVNEASVQGKSTFLPGETCRQAMMDGNPGREARLRRQGSAEAIVPALLGRAERQVGGPLSSSRDEPRRQNAPDRGTAGQGEAVKPSTTGQRVEQSPARDEGQSNAGQLRRT